MKKYFYISILLGAFALSGYTNVVDDKKEMVAESSPTEQPISIDNNVNTTKKEETAPIPLKLTQEQKEEYYQKYIAVIENINAVNDEDFELELEPITALLDEHWIEVEDFEKRAKEQANALVVVSENSELYNPMSVPKTVKLQIGSKEAAIIFKGSFDTQLNSNTPEGRQLFSAFNGVSSEAENSDGSWTQLDYNDSLIDGGTVYNITVGGGNTHKVVLFLHIL